MLPCFAFDVSVIMYMYMYLLTCVHVHVHVCCTRLSGYNTLLSQTDIIEPVFLVHVQCTCAVHLCVHVYVHVHVCSCLVFDVFKICSHVYA